MQKSVSRRKFNRKLLKTGAALSIASITPVSRILGANDRVRLGVIGTANRGCQVMDSFMAHSDCEIVALCDVHGKSMAEGRKTVGKKVTEYHDFRKLLEQKNMDAVIIATPDHWHALQFIASADAGKDIYIEKPMAHTIYEGRKMVESARKNNTVTQVGSQRRSVPHYIQVAQLIRSGAIGKISTIRFNRISNMYPDGIGNPPDSDPPPELDWDMWLGPARKVPYNENRCLYKFRWFSEYSSQVANWGAHYLDMVNWFLDEKGPVTVSAIGGNYILKDNRDISDTLQVTFEYGKGVVVTFGLYEASSGPGLPEGNHFEIRGTDGTIYTTYRGYTLIPADLGQAGRGTKQTRKITVKPKQVDGEWDESHHARNFLDCVKSRKRCNADVEDGHRASTACELGNIAYKTKSVIVWDPEKEKITSDESLNRHLHYNYRPPWKLA